MERQGIPHFVFEFGKRQFQDDRWIAQSDEYFKRDIPLPPARDFDKLSTVLEDAAWKRLDHKTDKQINDADKKKNGLMAPVIYRRVNDIDRGEMYG